MKLLVDNDVIHKLAAFDLLPAAVYGWCNGKRPWLGRDEREICSQRFRLLIRTAPNTYFTQSVSVISLPDPDELVGKAVDGVLEDFLQYIETKEELQRDRKKKEKVMRALEGFTDDHVWAFLEAPVRRTRRSLREADRDSKCSPRAPRRRATTCRTATTTRAGVQLPTVWYDPRSVEVDPAAHSSMQAKCVVADEEVVFVTSANFTTAAQSRNIELGLLVRQPSVARQAWQHFDSLAAAGLLRQVVLPG